MLLVAHRIDHTPTGLGLHCATDVPSGAVVYRYDPAFVRVIPLTEMEAYPEAVRAHLSRYVYDGAGADRLTDGVYYGLDDSRFMNHSETPSLVYRPEDETYVAARDLPAGTELTCDYRDFCTPGRWGFAFAANAP